jgi:hypothetical protein
MKHSISTLALVALVAIASLTQAHAQTHASKANVPFAFSYGNENFAAGTYTIELAGDSELAVTKNGHTRFVMIQARTDSDSPMTPGYVSFRRYGNSYFLAAYHTNGGVTFGFGTTSKERSLTRELAVNPSDSGTVRLALNDAVSSR